MGRRRQQEDYYEDDDYPTATKVVHGDDDDDDNRSHFTFMDRLAQYHATIGGSDGQAHGVVDLDELDNEVVQKLGMQMYHLPGNTSWCEDWYQYMANNHPVFGICLHHPLHPIKCCTRFVALIGTIVFGLMITNMFYLFFLWNPQYDKPVFTVSVDTAETTDNDDSSSSSYTLTTGMLLVWTLGGGIHTAYNLLMWHAAACICCRPGGVCESKACCPSFGKHLLKVFVVVNIVMAILIILLRVGVNNQYDNLEEQGATFAANVTSSNTNNNSTDNDDNNGSPLFFGVQEVEVDLEGHTIQEFQFLSTWAIEMALALFVYYPLFGTLMFSGLLGCCGRLPVIGGRPYEVAQEQKRQILENQQRLRQKQQQQQGARSETTSTTKNSSQRSARPRKTRIECSTKNASQQQYDYGQNNEDYETGVIEYAHKNTTTLKQQPQQQQQPYDYGNNEYGDDDYETGVIEYGNEYETGNYEYEYEYETGNNNNRTNAYDTGNNNQEYEEGVIEYDTEGGAGCAVVEHLPPSHKRGWSREF